MPEETLPTDRPTVVFSDEDAPSALAAQPEPAAAAANGAAEAAAALVAAATPAVAAGVELAAGDETPVPLADASAAAGVVSSAGGATAAAAAQGGGGGKAAGATFQLSDDVGLAVATFERARSRPANRQLLNLFVKEDNLVALWSEIGRVELEVVELRKASPKNVREQIDRLTMARNLLLSDKDEYEDVLRQVNIVKNNIQRLRNSNTAQQPITIQAFLYGLVAVLAWLFLVGPRLAPLIGTQPEVVGIPTQVLWNSILWGGIGGLSAAFYALVKHVEDYDPQHARWYYLSPMIGLFFGPLVALLADVGLPAFVQLVGDAPGDMQVRPAVMYLLAWAVGFKQNLLIQLINTVLAKIVPGIVAAEKNL